MAAPKGRPRPAGSGRVKGTPNKNTVEIKDMIRGALDAAGGQQYLLRQSEENPVAFMGLIGKVIPKDVNANITAEVIQKIQRVKLTPL